MAGVPVVGVPNRSGVPAIGPEVTTPTTHTARPSRRALLGGVAGVAAAAATGCSPDAVPVATATSTTAAVTPAGTPTPAAASTATGTRTPVASATSASVRPADWAALDRGLAGGVVLPGAAGFDTARHAYNSRFDAVRPAAVVRCADPADVVATLAFTRRFGLGVVPRGGGHSYIGASTLSGGVVLDTGPMATVTPDPASGTATVGAGARLVDVYRALDRSGLAVPAGSCPSVGIAGQTQGGGQGVVARAQGLTSDTVTAVTVVTADGRVRDVDAARDPDLFWALRGGGGGTFGVVTSFRVKPFPSQDCGVWSARWAWSAAEAVVAGWQRWVATTADENWANLHLEAVGSVPSVRVSGVTLGGSGDEALAELTRLVGVDPTSTSSTTHTWMDTVLLEAGCSRTGYEACHLAPAGGLDREAFVAGSSVLGGALPSAGITALTGIVAARARSGRTGAVIVDPLTGAVARGSTRTSAFPWRGALATVQWYVGLASTSTSRVADAQRFVAASRRTMGIYAVGAYVNYPDSSVTDPRTYHGSTSPRLAAVKRRYDPDGVFRTPTAVPA